MGPENHSFGLKTPQNGGGGQIYYLQYVSKIGIICLTFHGSGFRPYHHGNLSVSIFLWGFAKTKRYYEHGSNASTFLAVCLYAFSNKNVLIKHHLHYRSKMCKDDHTMLGNR